MNKQQTRQSIRKKRQRLSEEQQLQASEKLFIHILQLAAYQQAQHIALYLANDNEINPAPIIEDMFNKGKCCYLPIVDPIKPRQLLFMPYHLDTKMQTNRYGIIEPELITNKVRDPRELDLVITPLVAFDRACHRIGMGGGYYDNTFKFIKEYHQDKPLLIGIAYQLQQVESIPNEHWDVQLDAIVTDKRIWWRR